MNSLEDMESQAQRHLDGSRVNVDRMAKNVLVLVGQVRALQQQVHELRQQGEADEPTTVEVKGGSFNDAINEILDGLGKK
jgi:hypothetical protein